MSTAASSVDRTARLGRLRRFVRRAWRLAKWTVLALTVLAIIYVVWTNHRGAAAWDEIQDQMARRGVSASLYQWRHDHIGEPEPTRDGTGYYEAAMAFPEPRGAWAKDLPLLGIVDAPEARERIHPELTELLNRYMDDQITFFDLIEHGRAHDQFDYGLRMRGPAATGIEAYVRMRATARRLRLAALHAQAHGDDRAAGEAIERMLDFVASFDNEPLVITALVQISIEAMALEATEQMLSRLEPDPVTLAGLADRFQWHADRWHERALAALESELAGAMEQRDPTIVFEHNRRERAQAKAVLAEGFGVDLDPSWLDNLVSHAVRTWVVICPGWVKLRWAEQMSELLEGYDQVAAFGADWPALARFGADTDNVPPGDRYAMHSLMAAVASIQARLRAAQAAVHVELFRQGHGRWPDGLEKLEVELPSDPMDDQPLRNRETDTGLVIYSIGINFIDDNHFETSSARNVVFRLYDPTERSSRAPAHRTHEQALEAQREFDERFRQMME